nr:MAG TPA: hypothetical protein [Microviridae sp.]
MNINGINVFNFFLLMTAKDYLTALKVIREIQRKQAYCTGSSKPYLAETLKEIEMYCPLDFSKSGGRVTKSVILSCYSGSLFNV